jgi:hypothetical protein
MTGNAKNIVSMRRRIKYIQPKDRFGRTNSNSSMISARRHQLILHDAAHDVPGRDVDLLDEAVLSLGTWRAKSQNSGELGSESWTAPLQ